MNPTPAAVAAIRAQVSDWTPTDAAIAATLNAAKVANPTPRPTVVVPFTAADALALLSPASVANVLALPGFDRAVRPLLDAPLKDQSTLTGLRRWAGAYLKAGRITRAEFDALAAPAPVAATDAPTGLLNKNQPDPAWPKLIGWARAELGRDADADDVAKARP